ncbi:MAG: LPS export ABC transporter periplasmic protein LptC [Spirochaetales bacterium]|nr:LPS export ABC transporter periplasmic protein LptC [Spirochaetales bacterium]
MQKNRSFLLHLSCIVLILYGCSLDYRSANIPEEMAENLPETVFVQFSRIIVRDGKIKTKLEAERAENFTKKKQMVLSNIRFFEYDENEKLLTEGTADKAVLYTETDDVDIFGNIYLYSVPEKTAIYAETLYWKDKEEKLSAAPDDRVRVKEDEGSSIEGRGFNSDFKLREIVFANGVSGVFIQSKEE